MMIFPVRIELANVVAVQRLHEADARKHGRSAVAFGDQDHDFNGSLPIIDLLFGLRQFLDVSGSVLQRDELATARQRLNGRFQLLGALREEISALLRERQVGAGRMHNHIAALDSRLHGSRILILSAARGNELRIDAADLYPAGAWSASIPLAISSNLRTAVSTLASGRSSLNFIELVSFRLG
jgi:hypothetical protein